MSHLSTRFIAYPCRLRASWLLFAGVVLLIISPCTAAAFHISASAPPNSGLPRQWAPGDSVTFSASPPVPVGSLQWLHDERPISGATTSVLSLTHLGSSDSGNYRLRVTNGAAAELSEETLTMNVLPLPSGAVDTSFRSALPAPFYVGSVAAYAADGSMIVQSSYPMNPTQTLRLTSSGSMATGFSFPADAGFVLAGFPDGGLLTSNAPYRLNADGSTAAFVLPAAFDRAKPLTAAAVQADGRFYLAQSKVLVRFLADGTVDPTFTFANSVETGIGGLFLDHQHRLYVAGRRTDPIPSNFPSSWTTVYRVLSTGAVDRGFAEQTAVLLVGSLQITPLDDGRILYYSGYHGYRVWRMLRDDGTADPAWSGGSTFSERPITVNRATNQAYLVDTSYRLHRYLLTATGTTEDTQFFPGTSLVDGATITLAPDGRIILFGNFRQRENHVTESIVRLLPDAVAGVLPPNAVIGSADATPSKGATFTLNSNITGTGPFTYQWLALDGQPLPANTISSQLTITNFSAANLGRYQLRVTGLGGVSVLSNVTAASVDPTPPYLANLSGRAMSGTGEDSIIAGLSTKVSAGALGVSTLIRGAGPALKPLGVSGCLSNPALDLYNSSGQLIANNDQWSVNADVAAAASAAGAFGFEPNSNDAALLRSFYTGSASVMMKNQDPGAGIGLLEIYQLFPTGYEYLYQSLLNLSFRARTSPGEGTAIAGFVIVDPQNFDRPAKVLLRAVGPTLAASGIARPLENPILTVYNSRGQIVAQNDNWPSHFTAELTDYDRATTQVGAFPLPQFSYDAGLLVDLPAGAYSMHATGGSGVVLLEIYLVR